MAVVFDMGDGSARHYLANPEVRKAVGKARPRMQCVPRMRQALRSMYRAPDGRPWYDCLWDAGLSCLVVGRNNLEGGWTPVRNLIHPKTRRPRQLEWHDMRLIKGSVDKMRRLRLPTKVWSQSADTTKGNVMMSRMWQRDLGLIQAEERANMAKLDDKYEQMGRDWFHALHEKKWLDYGGKR